MAHVFYSETQRLSRAWLLILSFDSILCLSIVGVVTKGRMETQTLLITLLLVVVFAFVGWVLSASKLEVKIDDQGIHFRYPVFWPRWKKLAREEIRQTEIRHYNPLFRYKDLLYKSFVIQGDEALYIELANGKRYIIGTQNKEGILHALNRLMKPTD